MPELLKKLVDKLRKKSFWLPDSVALKVEKEARDTKKWKSESVLMTHIINQWFKK